MINTNVTILYGSETGTAEDVAEQIWKSAKRFCYCSLSILYTEQCHKRHINLTF